jgi:hypothetical protein
MPGAPDYKRKATFDFKVGFKKLVMVAMMYIDMGGGGRRYTEVRCFAIFLDTDTDTLCKL